MPNQVNKKPAGYHTLTPYLVVKDGARALDFYKKAFGATVIVRMDGPGGKIGHAELKVGDSIFMLSDEMMGNRSPESFGGSPVGIFMYVDDVDAAFKQAVDAGASTEMPPADMFWGDRYGRLTDPFGHKWSLATHIEDVSPEEMKKRVEAATAQMSQASGQG